MTHQNDNVVWMSTKPFDQMDKVELLRNKTELEAEIRSIHAQIAQAKSRRYATGELADRDWFSRAHAALDYRRRLVSRIQERLTEMKIRNRAVGSEIFIQAAKEVLDEATYEEVARRAEELGRRT